MAVACGRQTASGTDSADSVLTTLLPGDSTLYGLAADGCSDSILVFLPGDASRLDTFDIVNARREHRVYGRPAIGDELAVVLNPENRTEALMVVNLDKLTGDWCYLVTPTFRQPVGQPSASARQQVPPMPDSVRQRLMTPREYCIRLKRGFTAQTTGGQPRQTTSDDRTPVEYPPLKRYSEWHLYNGKLLLSANTAALPGQKEAPAPETDTVTIERLAADTLVLRFPDHVQGYYRKAQQD